MANKVRRTPGSLLEGACKGLLAGGLALLLGEVFGVLSLGGCGGAPAGVTLPGTDDGQIPEDVVASLTECGAQGPRALQRVEHALDFDVFVDTDSEVDTVLLRSSTLPDETVQDCMARALYRLSAPAAEASLRRRTAGADVPASPEARGLLANPIAIPAAAVGAVLVIGLMVITVVVHYQVLHNTKRKHRPHPSPPPPVQAPPKPDKAPEPKPEPKPEPRPPPPPLPPPPLPPPREVRETCEGNMPQFIRCDDPKISHYTPRTEDVAFREIVASKGKGLRKEKSGWPGTGGPCKGRGGFHTNVLRDGGYVASIVGCDCCDDSSGKAVKRQRANILYKK